MRVRIIFINYTEQKLFDVRQNYSSCNVLLAVVFSSRSAIHTLIIIPCNLWFMVLFHWRNILSTLYSHHELGYRIYRWIWRMVERLGRDHI